jgi:hypothetical protein
MLANKYLIISHIASEFWTVTPAFLLARETLKKIPRIYINIPQYDTDKYACHESRYFIYSKILHCKFIKEIQPFCDKMKRYNT